MNINLEDYDLIAPTSIEKCISKNEKFIDINVEDDHSFFVHLGDGTYVLSHNCDGAHITTLYIGFFSKFCPSIIKAGRLKKLLTPIICMKDSKENIKEMFFTLDEYNDWLKKNKTTNLKTHYYKGLGSWEKKDLQDLVKRFGIDKFIQTLEYDENSVKLIDDWLSKKKTDERKEYLRENNFSIFSM